MVDDFVGGLAVRSHNKTSISQTQLSTRKPLGLKLSPVVHI